MPTLTWSDQLALGVAHMDQTHREFVALLARAEDAADPELLKTWEAVVEHTRGHFGAEDRAMLATRFAASNCHTTHHKMVLEVMEHGLALGGQGDLAPIRQMTRELATWFVHHADTMDAALAGHLLKVGYQPETGAIAHPQALPAEMLHGCGSASCGPDDGSSFKPDEAQGVATSAPQVAA